MSPPLQELPDGRGGNAGGEAVVHSRAELGVFPRFMMRNRPAQPAN